MLRCGLVVLVSVLVAGCGSVAGVATPAVSDRPREIRLDAVDPCALFTPAVRQALGTTRPLNPSSGGDPIYQGNVPGCGSRGEGQRWFDVAVDFALHDGIEIYRPDRVNGTLTPLRVQGFPALVVKQDKFTDECAVIVDVAPGQLADVTYRDGGNRPRTPQAQLCGHARQAADLLMAELLRKH
ncbi:MAG: DUF3558 domain-containing protein [Pseudonocardia sp.]|nr:DUF3558 domain-containing protein [Pseudonocardia sp.]